jgi:transcription antitermination factor NusG
MMKRGDRVRVDQGTYVGCTGIIIFVDHDENLATVGLDQHRMMLKISTRNLSEISCSLVEPEV